MKCLQLAWFLFWAATTSSAQEKSAPWFVDKFKVSTGFFSPINNTAIKVNIKVGPAGSDIDFERDLGFAAEVNTFMFSGQWRASQRSRFSLSYYKIDRKSTYTLVRDIVFQGQTYNINASINSYLYTSIIQFSYGYALLSKPKYEAGLMIGTHLVGVDIGLSINSGSGAISGNSDFGFTAPLPDLGIWGGYAITDRLALQSSLSYLAMTVGNVQGSIFALDIALRYRLVQKLDVSLGYTGLNCSIDVEKTYSTGSFDWGYNGPSFEVHYSFGKWKSL